MCQVIYGFGTCIKPLHPYQWVLQFDCCTKCKKVLVLKVLHLLPHHSFYVHHFASVNNTQSFPVYLLLTLIISLSFFNIPISSLISSEVFPWESQCIWSPLYQNNSSLLLSSLYLLIVLTSWDGGKEVCFRVMGLKHLLSSILCSFWIMYNIVFTLLSATE